MIIFYLINSLLTIKKKYNSIKYMRFDEKKVLDHKTLILKLSKFRNKKIVHCHGVFDLLHPGHIEYFKEAKSLGDILIVSLTADIYVNKGHLKPVFNHNLRAFTLANLKIVDFVYVNNSLDSVKLINAIKPNFYVKGPDYKNQINDINLVKEKKAVEKNLGRIYFTSGNLFSSTKILNENLVSFNSDQRKTLNKLKSKFKKINLISQIKEISKLKVLVIGEVIIDEYIFCEAIGKSGKEPVMVNKKIKSEKYAGGSISIANSIAKFCNKVELLTFLGDRKNEKKFIKQKIEKNIKLDFVIKKDSPTIIKSRIIDKYSGNKLGAIYDLNDEDLDVKNEIIIINKLKKIIKKYDLVVLADYGHGLFTKKIIKFVELNAKFVALNLQLNSINQNFQKIEKYQKIDLLCLHERELRNYIRTRENNNDKLISKLKKIIKFNKIIITKGNKGSKLYSENKRVECPAFANTVVDRVGAGDTLFGISSILIFFKLDDLFSLFISNIAAGDSIKNIGTASLFNKNQLIRTIEYLLK